MCIYVLEVSPVRASQPWETVCGVLEIKSFGSDEWIKWLSEAVVHFHVS